MLETDQTETDCYCQMSEMNQWLEIIKETKNQRNDQWMDV